MLVLERLQISRLRNLAAVDIRFTAPVTLFIGPNGAGKTTLVEAVYLVSRGRSFRGRRFGGLVTDCAGRASVVSEVAWQGLSERLKWDSQAVVGQGGAGAGNGGQRLPVRLICDQTHQLVEGDPTLRRRFVDWNLFHVEPSFARLRSEFRRIAGQRNAWLRGGGRGSPVWDAPYAELLCRIGALRTGLFATLAVEFRRATNDFGGFADLVPEWTGEGGDVGSVVDRLRAMRDADIARGHTWLGPSRADFSFRQGRRRWVGSRGENKIVGTLLQLAADAGVVAQTRQPAVWLLDDLAAELAPAVREPLFDLVRRRSEQVLMTALPGANWCVAEHAHCDVFHVEQGVVLARE